VRLASAAFTRAGVPEKVTVEPLVGPITMPLKSVTASVPPFREVSVTV